MIIEGLDKVSRKEFKALLAKVDGVMLRTHNIKGYDEPKNIEVVFVCLSLEQSIDAHAEVKSALAEVRSNSNARFLA
jgi:hypothetical protein